MDILKLLIEYETSLFSADTRSNKDNLITLLHQDFIEIGYSGITYDLNQIIESITLEKPTNTTLHAQNFELKKLDRLIYVLMYKSADINNENVASRFAKRSSIWCVNEGQWQMKFHQATAIDPFRV